MNNKYTFFCCAFLLMFGLGLSLPQNYEDIEESEDQPQNAKGIKKYYVIIIEN